MAIPFTSEIIPKGSTTEAKLADLVIQLQRQNRELKVIIQDLYRIIEEGKRK